jgi:hypothetical protein
MNREYGSGYPGITGRGTDGRGFPFIFWPLAWGGEIFPPSSAYLHTTEVSSNILIQCFTTDECSSSLSTAALITLVGQEEL